MSLTPEAKTILVQVRLNSRLRLSSRIRFRRAYPPDQEPEVLPGVFLFIRAGALYLPEDPDEYRESSIMSAINEHLETNGSVHEVRGPNTVIRQLIGNVDA